MVITIILDAQAVIDLLVGISGIAAAVVTVLDFVDRKKK